MIWLLIPYLIIGAGIAIYGWGFATLDISLKDIDWKSALMATLAGLLWPITLIVALVWFTWVYHTWR